MQKIKEDFYEKCKLIGVTPLTDISTMDYVSKGTQISYKCDRGDHCYRTALGTPECRRCLYPREFRKRGPMGMPPICTIC